MLVFLNGQFIPEEQARVSVFDRGFLYGDSLFETVRVSKNRPFLWHEHWHRFERGAKFLKIPLPFSSEDILNSAQELIRRNSTPEAVLRFQLSRGVGTRGYSPQSARSPTFIMSVHPMVDRAPEKWKVIISQFRTNPHDPLSGIKTGNKLPQILAKGEADARGADEALLLSADGFIAEGTSSNVFWVEGNTVCTTPPSLGILPGITRATVLKLCKVLKSPVRECTCTLEALKRADGVFVTLTSHGIIEVGRLDDIELQHVALTKALTASYQELLAAG